MRGWRGSSRRSIGTLKIHPVKNQKPEIKPRPTFEGWQICVVDNGFVFVGLCDNNAPETVLIQHVKQLRRWGTEHGLGQLVEGPTPNTIMDVIPVILVPRSRVVFTIPVNADKWSKI